MQQITYCFDIDGTICFTPIGSYAAATPYKNRIESINKLYDEGHCIKYFTARGATTGLDWTELTTHQLKDWGCKYHELIMKKPHFDYFIDDKAFNSDFWFGIHFR